MDPGDLDTALKELLEEQRRLARLRSEYDTIRRSRFYAVRQVWLSLKQLLRGAAAPALAQAEGAAAAELSEAPVSSEVAYARLRETWARRTTENPTRGDVVASVVIPIFNNLDVTVRCLQSIADVWFDTLKVEVIVVDDASTDASPQMLADLPGVKFLRNPINSGFVASCNAGAAAATGRYICFLNNDTVVRPGWLDYLVTLVESDPTAGAAGSKLVYPDGRLQEAGGIIFNDGSGWNYGRFEDPSDARYNYMRAVDYCSGAALLVQTALFREIGGFSETFAPAYYEDVDLCFQVRAHGKRVLYQPKSEVVHYEGVSSGTDTSIGMKRFQVINKPKFVEKWSPVLKQHCPPGASNVPAAARRLRSGRTILVVDSYVPLYDKEAGSLRLMRILEILLRANFNIIFLPDNYAALQPYTRELQATGVEVLHHIHGGRPPEKALDTVLPILDFAWICRPNLFAKYADRIKRNAATKLIYDTIDLHFVRKQRELKLQGIVDDLAWQSIRDEELAAAMAADATITVTEDERSHLEELGVQNVYVVPTLHERESNEGRSFADREGVLFIGSYAHGPNADAAMFLCKEIMPIIWERNPGVSVTLLGNNPSAELVALQSDRVRVPGYVSDVSSYFEQSRVFAAPLRFGAGMKGKVGQSLSFGLPVVTTAVGAEGFDLANGVNCRVAESAQDLAAAILDVYGDRAIWERLSAASAEVIRPLTGEVVGPKIIQMLNQLAATRSSAAAT